MKMEACRKSSDGKHDHVISRDLACDPVVQEDLLAVDSIHLAVCRYCSQVAIRMIFHTKGAKKKIKNTRYVVLKDGS